MSIKKINLSKSQFQKELHARTTDEWVKIINKLPSNTHIKIVCTVYWDYCQSQEDMRFNEYFRTRLDNYVADRDELEPDLLYKCLIKLGYSEYNAKVKRVTASNFVDKSWNRFRK